MILRSVFLVGLLLGVACSNCTTSSAGTAQPARAPSDVLAKAPKLAPELESIEVPKPDPREPRLAAAVLAVLERHVRPHAIDDSISKQAFTTYLERLDPGKLILLKQQVTALEQASTQLDDELRAGEFRTARLAAALVAQERKKVAASIAKMLEAPLDFSQEEYLETDPKKLTFAANEAEREDRWRRALKQQVLERIDRMEETAKAIAKLEADPTAEKDAKATLTPPPPTFEGREKKAREELARIYAGRFVRLSKQEPLETAEMFVNAFTSAFDPHTLYIAPEQQEDFDIQISGALEGIGAVLSEDDHYISVREVVPGGAAWRQGQLEAGDLIMAVKQTNAEAVDVADMRIGEVVRMIRGPKGTLVTLTVKKPDERVMLVEIKRDVVVVEDAYARGALLEVGPKHDAYGYIHLPGFYGNTRSSKGNTPERDATGDVRALLDAFSAKKVHGVVLDLRGNGGGLLNQATGITGLFVDQGPVVAARDAQGETMVLGDEHPGVSFDGQVVVLVDRFSASAAEILAGALQDYHRALVVGTGPTHGKGTVQAMVDLDRVVEGTNGPPLGMMKLTIQQYFLVDGESTQWKGVEPDVVLPDPAAHVESGERYLDHAIAWSKIAPLQAVPWSNAPWSSAALAEKSRARQTNQPAFAQVRARGDYLLQRRKDTLLPLKREAWELARDKDRAALDQLDPKLDKGPELFGVKVIEYGPKAAVEAKHDDSDKKRVASTGRAGNWQTTLSHDPWVQEALFLLGDMTEKPAKPKATVATTTK